MSFSEMYKCYLFLFCIVIDHHFHSHQEEGSEAHPPPPPIRGFHTFSTPCTRRPTPYLTCKKGDIACIKVCVLIICLILVSKRNNTLFTASIMHLYVFITFNLLYLCLLYFILLYIVFNLQYLLHFYFLFYIVCSECLFVSLFALFSNKNTPCEERNVEVPVIFHYSVLHINKYIVQNGRN